MRQRRRLRFISAPAGTTQLRMDAPGVLRRIVAVSVTLDSPLAGECLRLTLSAGGNTIARVTTGPLLLNEAYFVLGGALSSPHVLSFTPATGVYAYTDDDATGPLPDFWLEPDLGPVLLAFGAESAAFNITSLGVLIEETPIDDPQR